MMKAKPFTISQYLVFAAYNRVSSNKGSGGVDGISLAEFNKNLESHLYQDSYGYRPKKRTHEAVAKARERCWKYDWVIDIDIKGFPASPAGRFDNIPHDLLMKAARKHCKVKWMLLYIERWLVAPLQKKDGETVARTKGVPQ